MRRWNSAVTATRCFSPCCRLRHRLDELLALGRLRRRQLLLVALPPRLLGRERALVLDEELRPPLALRELERPQPLLQQLLVAGEPRARALGAEVLHARVEFARLVVEAEARHRPPLRLQLLERLERVGGGLRLALRRRVGGV